DRRTRRVISLKPEYLTRYKDIALLLFKYGRGDLVQRAGLAELIPDEPDTRTSPHAAELADDLEKLGPTFVKLGQLLSTRPDLIPAAYAEGLKRLQDHCEPFPYAQVEP